MNEIKWPPHLGGMIIRCDDHKTNYESVAEYISRIEDVQGCEEDWVSEAEKEKAIMHNVLWRLEWYPNTPVGFNTICASSFEALVEWMNQNHD